MISAVIPTLNAAATLGPCLQSLAAADEIIVADGGSSDATAEITARHGAHWLPSERGRGQQLAAGAMAAKGDLLLFIHADTHLEEGWRDDLLALPADKALAFRLAFDTPHPAARRIERLANWRATVLGLPYGDQGLALTRPFYDALGGYQPLPLMEDVDMVRRIGRRRLCHSARVALTSAERYQRDGWWSRPLRNLGLLGLYFMGMAPERLAALYARP
ncbi:MAG: TIGR04283 family arsenosugar biosynthesis glycosyltransferase [Rhodospirillales bacterium]